VFTGFVHDGAGQPLGDVDVVLCASDEPCEALARDQPSPVPPLFRTRTDARGMWHAELTLVVKDVLFLGAGYLDTRYATPNPNDLIDITLPPAVALDIVPHCAKPCADWLITNLYVQDRQYTWIKGTHASRVPRHRYTIEVLSNARQAGEQAGRATIDATTGDASFVIDVTLAPTGTGQAITVRGAPAHAMVNARCGDVTRSVDSKNGGEVTLDDVGPPPCQIECWVDVHSDFEVEGSHWIHEDRLSDMCKGRTVTTLPARVDL
jgi:hypothetical protein